MPLIALVLTFQLIVTTARACAGFVLRTDRGPVVARNVDLPFAPAYLVRNSAGIAKQAYAGESALLPAPSRISPTPSHFANRTGGFGLLPPRRWRNRAALDLSRGGATFSPTRQTFHCEAFLASIGTLERDIERLAASLPD